jgi:branched-chain amino acid transport system ATP-binding protein
VNSGLLLQNFCVGYGDRWVLQGLNVHCTPGTLLYVQGDNGDGRSTLLKGIMGLSERHGQISLNDQSLADLASWQIARLGVGYAPEQRDVFRGLSVAEHFRLAGLAARHEPVVTQQELLEALPALKARWQHAAHLLSGGEQKMLALARAILTGRYLVLLDEPCEGLAENVQLDILQLLNRLAQRGIIIVLTGAITDALCPAIVAGRAWIRLDLKELKKADA